MPLELQASFPEGSANDREADISNGLIQKKIGYGKFCDQLRKKYMRNLCGCQYYT